ncbi:MAG: hypothetical protein H7250_03245 [Flavobacterium sp.]|nr:hypothetical protein [Flavobacterium sp.]
MSKYFYISNVFLSSNKWALLEVKCVFFTLESPYLKLLGELYKIISFPIIIPTFAATLLSS